MVITKNISPPDPNRLHDPKHWHDKAEQARAKAEEMTDVEAKKKMERVAETYDRLADDADKRNEKPN